MKELLPLTPEQLARAEARLRNPTPGSKIEAAQKFGVDLTLLIGQLRLSPAERVSKMHDIAEDLEKIRGSARRIRK